MSSQLFMVFTFCKIKLILFENIYGGKQFQNFNYITVYSLDLASNWLSLKILQYNSLGYVKLRRKANKLRFQKLIIRQRVVYLTLLDYIYLQLFNGTKGNSPSEIGFVKIIHPVCDVFIFFKVICHLVSNNLCYDFVHD